MMSRIFIIIFIIIQGLIAAYLLAPFFMLLFNRFFGRSRKAWEKKFPIVKEKSFNFGIIVTAHQDVRFIDPLVDSILKQTYMNFHVYVVADDCDVRSLHYSDKRVTILCPTEPLHAKIWSIQYAIDHFEAEHEVLMVFDADNLVHPTCFEWLNDFFKRGYKAVQAHMLSKNTETIYEKLDTMGHTFNTFMDRQSRMNLGMSSSITGSGTAVETGIYCRVLYSNVLGGFDKKLQADILRATPLLGFSEDAIVYDEKVADAATMEKQRTRWIYTYFRYFPVYISLLYYGVRKFSFNIIYFAFSALRPPLFITLGLAFLFAGADLFINPMLSVAMAGVMLIFTISFIIIVLSHSRISGMFHAILHIPALVYRQLRALLRMKQASKSFLKTEHNRVMYIDELLNNEST